MPAETIFAGKHLRLLRTGRWEYVERIEVSGVAVILPVTPEQKIILAEQFRPAVGRRVVALPAGLAGDGEKESTLAAARRELLEETGYTSAHWTKLTEGPSSSGLTSEIITIYLAVEAKRGERPPAEGGEDIQVHEIPRHELLAWLRAKEAQGCLIDYKIFAALYLEAHPPDRAISTAG
jgi:ADP-ribose pyrophosphatase